MADFAIGGAMIEGDATEPVADAVGEAVGEAVADVVADVVADQEAAGEIHELIAEAALEGERGNRIAQLEKDLLECQNRLTEIRVTLETLPEAIAGQTLALLEPISSRLSALEDGQSAMIAAAISSTPPILAELEPEIAEPETAETPPDVAAESPAPPRARRFRLM